MKLNNLMGIFRQEADDRVQPYLWSDDELIEYANDAQDEACRRARLLVDSTTAEITEIAVTAGNGVVTLDPRVLFVRRARLTGYRPLIRRNMQDMESDFWYWQDAARGLPQMFIPDVDTGKIILFPTPLADATLRLTVVRMPLADMNDGNDTPEILPRYHRSLRFWMLYRAYSKQDSQTRDEKKAADNLALFEQEFGKKSAAIDENWIEHEQTELDGTY